MNRIQSSPVELARTGAMPLVSAVRPRDRSFWAGLASAALVHLALIALVGQDAAKSGRATSGGNSSLNVDVVSEDELQRLFGAQPPDEKVTETATEVVSARPTPEVAEPAPKPADPSPRTALQLDDTDLSGLLSLKPAPAQQRTAAADPRPATGGQASPKIDFNLPAGAMLDGSSSGRSTGVSRPAGITQSGENDAFGRGVIDALRKTMPDSRGKVLRLTVRVILNAQGNLAEARVVTSSGYPMLDQDVLFSIKQSNFPIPAAGLKPVDWIFVVTYIYR